MKVKATSFPKDGKLSLKADEPQVGQRQEDVERNWEYYHIIISQEWTCEIYDASSYQLDISIIHNSSDLLISSILNNYNNIHIKVRIN